MTKSSRPSKAPKEAKAPTGAKPGGKANVNEVAVNEGRWEDDEHERFLEAMAAYKALGDKEGMKKWPCIAEAVGTRTTLQCRSHAQKHYIKEQKRLKELARVKGASKRGRKTKAAAAPAKLTAEPVVFRPQEVHRVTPPVSLNGSPETSCYGAFPADADFATTLDTGSLLEQVLLKLPRDEETDETRPAPIAAKVVDDDAPGPVAPIPRLPKLDDAEDEALKLYDAPHIFSAPPSPKIYEQHQTGPDWARLGQPDWGSVMDTLEATIAATLEADQDGPHVVPLIYH